MPENYDLIIMGDINLDWVVRGKLPFHFGELTVNGRIEWMPIDKKPGGSGLNFARFARQMGYRPLLLGKVGDDFEGEFIILQLEQEELAAGVVRDSQVPTGLALIARDSHGIRFLVNNPSNANQYLSAQDVRRFQAEIEGCRVLYVSGYCFMHPDQPRTAATHEAMRIAAQAKAHIVFDVVPHEFYRIEPYNDFPKFRRLTRDVSVLISEVATIRRFLHLGDRTETITNPLVEEAVEYLKPHFERFILRWGPSGCDYQVIWDAPTQREIWEETGHDLAEDKRGFGDRLALKVLKDVYNI